VSDWSTWDGQCPEGCGMLNETRVRTVLVAPNNGGNPCPEVKAGLAQNRMLITNWPFLIAVGGN